MLQQDFSCKPLNKLVQQYHFIINSTLAHSEERKEASVIYNRILTYLENHSQKTFNLNKLAPQTLHFLEVRGLKLHTRRAGTTKVKKKKRKRKGPKSWDYRQV